MGGRHSRNSQSGCVFLVLEYDDNIASVDTRTGHFRIAKAYDKLMGEDWGRDTLLRYMDKGNPRLLSVFPDASFHVKDAEKAKTQIRHQIIATEIEGVQKLGTGWFSYRTGGDHDPIPKVIEIMGFVCKND